MQHSLALGLEFRHHLSHSLYKAISPSPFRTSFLHCTGQSSLARLKKSRDSPSPLKNDCLIERRTDLPGIKGQGPFAGILKQAMKTPGPEGTLESPQSSTPRPAPCFVQSPAHDTFLLAGCSFSFLHGGVVVQPFSEELHETLQSKLILNKESPILSVCQLQQQTEPSMHCCHPTLQESGTCQNPQYFLPGKPSLPHLDITSILRCETQKWYKTKCAD